MRTVLHLVQRDKIRRALVVAEGCLVIPCLYNAAAPPRVAQPIWVRWDPVNGQVVALAKPRAHGKAAAAPDILPDGKAKRACLQQRPLRRRKTWRWRPTEAAKALLSSWDVCKAPLQLLMPRVILGVL